MDFWSEQIMIAFIYLYVHSENLFWFGLDKCQVPTKTALSLPLLKWTGKRK